jgi:hypothetical protein
MADPAIREIGGVVAADLGSGGVQQGAPRARRAARRFLLGHHQVTGSVRGGRSERTVPEELKPGGVDSEPVEEVFLEAKPEPE